MERPWQLPGAARAQEGDSDGDLAWDARRRAVRGDPGLRAVAVVSRVITAPGAFQSAAKPHG